MKLRIGILLLATSAALLVQGCIAFPPLIQVEHKEQPQQVSNQDLMRRLDEIDRRLNTMEQQQTAKEPAKPATQ